VESLSAISSGKEIGSAVFKNYNVENHPGNFTSRTELSIPQNANPSLWDMPSVPHGNGSNYLVVVGLKGKVNLRNFNSNQDSQALYAYVVPVSLHKKALTDYPHCWYLPNIDRATLVGNDSHCTGSEGQYVSETEPRCAAAAGLGGDCYAPEAFPNGVQFKLKLRLAKEPIGWIHGRISNPDISVSSMVSGGVALSVAANPVRVPVFYSNGRWSNLSDLVKKWWVDEFPKCLSSPDCNGTASGSNPEHPDVNIPSNVIFENAPPYGTVSMALIKYLSSEVKDTSPAAPSAWSFRSLENTWGNSVNPCITSGIGLKGIVTTNSTTYSQGAPEFADGNLNYKVASLHYLPDGSVFHGTYDLILRSDVARCLYKFSAAPISATISVLSENGSAQVTSTSVVERAGWIYLSANGFTFSSPTVQIKLTQTPSKVVKVQTNATPAKKTTITCVKGKTTKKVTAVKPACPTGYKKK
jgi:hypothetical protein